MFNLSLIGDRELVARLGSMPVKVMDALYRKTITLALALERKVKQKLSGPVLNVVSGALRRSIKSRWTRDARAVSGQVFSSGDVKYARIHEFGGKTRAHEIVAKSGKELAFMAGGKQVFAARVMHPGSLMPERSYMRTSLAEMKNEITEGYREAVVQGSRS